MFYLRKIFIKDLVSPVKPFTSINEIRGHGIKMIHQDHKKLTLELDERVYLLALTYYHSFVERKLPQYIPILLDSTASGQQILAKICKVTDLVVLESLNLYQNKV